MPTENGGRLNSWKEIAAYFGKGERTVKRWEAERGLPVHRLPGGAGSTVFAYAGELDQWLRATQPEPEEAEPGAPVRLALGATGPDPDPALPPRPSSFAARPGRWTIVAGGVAIAIAAVGLLGLRSDGGSVPATAGAVGAVQDTATPRHTPDPEAEDLYFQGMYYWNRRTPDDLNRALHLFNQAIAEDPTYAKAFVGLANCYNLLREYTLMPADEAYPKAKAAAERAIALDDTLAEAHSSLAFGEFFWFWKSQEARQSFERALELDPNSVQTRHWHATTLMYMGDYDRALAEITSAQRLDPESRSILADKGLILYYVGREEESVQLLKQLAIAEPDYLSPYLYLSAIYFAQGKFDDHIRMARQVAVLLEDDHQLTLVEATAVAYERAGAAGLLEALLEGQRRLYAEGNIEAYWVARTYAYMEQNDKALTLLRTSIDRHEQSALILRMDPAFRGLRADETFRKMVVDVGLPPLT